MAKVNYPHFPASPQHDPAATDTIDHDRLGRMLATEMVKSSFDSDGRVEKLRAVISGFDVNPVFDGAADASLRSAINAFIDLPAHANLMDIYLIWKTSMIGLGGVLRAWDLQLSDYDNDTTPDPDSGHKIYHTMAVPDPYV